MYTQEFEFDHPFSRQGKTVQEALQVRGLQMREAIDKEMHGILDSGTDEKAYISSVINATRWGAFLLGPDCYLINNQALYAFYTYVLFCTYLGAG